ncbi:MAG: DUF502 domain-containing protein [Chthoniobacteraceae bacterium]
MKRLAAFLKATTLGGLFVVLPVVVVLGLAAKTVLGMRAAGQSILEMMMGQDSAAVHFPVLFAALIVVAISFVLGLTMISRRGHAVGSWIERTLLFRMPGYTAVRAIVGGLANADSEGVVKAALLMLGEGAECFVFVTEDHGDGRLTIFIPGSPNPASGSVQIVPRDKVRLLNVRITDIGDALQHWGVGTQKVLAKDRAASPPAAAERTAERS